MVVDTKNGNVILTGTANTEQAKDLAQRLSYNTVGVVTVENNIIVKMLKPTAAESIKNSTNKIGRSIADSWITTKVKSTFLYSNSIEGNNINVVTNKGAVTLKGSVHDGAEKALAIELSKNIRGVNHVNTDELTIKP